MAWDAAGWIDGIVVSSSYIHTADTAIEAFAEGTVKARVYGELNYVHFQAQGTGHNPNDRRYLTPETYRAATLSYLGRGADGVSFFNTYCVPPAELKKLTAELLTKYRDLDTLRASDKNYTTYANRGTIFGRIFPARNDCKFQVFIADEVPGLFSHAILRLETREPSQGTRIEAWVNETKLTAYHPENAELFPPVAINHASPRLETLTFFTVPLSLLRFGANRIRVENLDGRTKPCDFVSSELGLYLRN